MEPNIALIEDDEDDRENLATLLRRAGYRVTPYASAAKALEGMDCGAPTDVILLDLMMPGMNGWQFRILQRSMRAIADVPVIVLSGDSSPHAQAIDAQAYMLKPVDVERLCVVIANVLHESRRAQLAQKAVEMERLRSLGMLVASVAHEVNNPLAYLMGNLDLLEQRLSSTLPNRTLEQQKHEADLNQHVLSIRDGAERIAFIVRLLSTFVRSNEDDVANVDVLRAIDAATRLSQLQIRAKARLVCQLEPVPLVWANEGRLAQVFLNLLMNAAQALPEGDPDHHAVTVRSFAADDHAVVEVHDTGVGISDKVRRRMFEPFYTTKAVGVGTGLGLSISREIVSALGGTLTFSSAPSHGTTFRVTLPTSTHALQTPRAAPAAQATEPVRVLVVDDEAMIGRLVQVTLSKCDVQTTVDAAVALEWFADRTYDLILCDLNMPSMTGFELYERLSQLRPDLTPAFVLTTGAALNDIQKHFLDTRSISLLRKPFTVRELKELAAEHSPSRVAAQ